LIINITGALLIGFVSVILYHKAALEDPQAAAIFVITGGAYLLLSSLYIVLFLIDQNYSFPNQFAVLASAFAGNILICVGFIWLGYLAGKDI
jgi:fluoride ion exporter CrcB/FEX